MSSKLDAAQIIQQIYNDTTNSLSVVPVGGSIVGAAYDYLSVAYPTTSSEVYTYKTGGSGGTTVATVTVVYTDATKDVLTSITKV